MKDFVTRQLQNLQTSSEGHLNKAIGELTTEMSMIPKQGNWSTYKPTFKDIVSKQLKSLQPKVEELEARQVRTLQSKGQGNCSQALEEFATQGLEYCSTTTNNLQPQSRGQCNAAIEERSNQRSITWQQGNWRAHMPKVNEIVTR